MKQFFLQRSCIDETQYQLGVAKGDPATVILSDGAVQEWTDAMAAAVPVEEPPPVEPPPVDPPPSGELPPGYSPLLMGNVECNAETHPSIGFGINQVLMATLVVPALPNGKQTISIFEIDANRTSRRAWISKTPWDMSATKAPYYLANQGPVFQYEVGEPGLLWVPFIKGETWHIMVTNQDPFPPYKPSVKPDQIANIGIRWYPIND